MGNIADELDEQMRCPLCGELSDSVRDNRAYLKTRACNVCMLIAEDEHMREPCSDLTCPCQPIR